MTEQFPAVVYDIESFPNFFCLYAVDLWTDREYYFEISEFQDDRRELRKWFTALQAADVDMIGFNNLHYDYAILHFMLSDMSNWSAPLIYQKSQQILSSYSDDGPRREIWQDDRFIPQIDVFKIHHFDNRAKSTGLKALQINMRSENVMESPIPFGTFLTNEQRADVAGYCRHDTLETKKFTLISMPMIEFRRKLRSTLTGDVLNFNDTKIGKQLLIQRLGDICYVRDANGRKQPRQTVRHRIRLAECIFPYIAFNSQEFSQMLDYLRAQEITQTKGAFEDLSVTVKGFSFVFGTGGIHGSVKGQRLVAGGGWVIRDIDVASLYPSIAIVNALFPEHLGNAFINEYRALRTERFSYAKGSAENDALKLALNGVYGDSNSPFSVFYDPKFTMSITINGQLLLCMLAEWLMTVPTVQLIQINTDGVTYLIHESMLPVAQGYEKAWQEFTKLDLEDAAYSRVWIRDVNSYIAETTSGKLKLKGAYWTPTKHPEDIQNQKPTGWHRDYSADICAKAAVAYMVHGKPIETFIREWPDDFDFMLREKIKRSDILQLDGIEQQKTFRYYMGMVGGSLRKIAPPTHPERMGWFKPGAKTNEAHYIAWHEAWGNVHNPDIHTKNKSVYEDRISNIQAGFKVVECNHTARFDRSNINYEWYINEARKLVI